MFKEITILIAGFVSMTLLAISLMPGINSCLNNLKIDNYRRRIKNQLSSAGSPQYLIPETFITLKLISAVVFLMLTSVCFGKINTISLLAGILGFSLPSLWLRKKISQRRDELRRHLPYFLDILVLAIEAGMEFIPALEVILEKVETGALKEEFSILLNRIKMGRMRRDALEDMRSKLDLPELSSVLSALIQTDMLGTAPGKILRIQADTVRRKQADRAEKLAMQAPVKLLIPLIGFIFPAVFIVLLGPILLQLISRVP